MFRIFSTSDAQLVQKALEGRRDAFGTLVERYLKVAYAVAYSRVNVHADAEDVAQESFLKAYQSLDTLREPARFGAWLAAIVRHTASRVRERRLHEAVATERSSAEEAVVMPDHERRELCEIIRTEVYQLEEPDREVILLHYFAGQSSREIAGTLGSTSVAVRKRLQRAREHLGERLLKNLAGPTVAPREKAKHIMGLVAATPAPWETTAGGVSAGGALTVGGFGVMKFIGLIIALTAIIATSTQLLPRRVQESTPPSIIAPTGNESADTTTARPPDQPTVLAQNDSPPLNDTPNARETAERRVPIEMQAMVLDPDGNPVAGAPITISLHARSSTIVGYERSDSTLATKAFHTDANGYVMADFGSMPTPEGYYMARWRVALPGMYRFLRSGGISHGRNLFTLQLQQTGTIRGTVRDDDGNPLQGARVTPFKYEPALGGETSAVMPDVRAFTQDDRAVVTAADGSFRMDTLYEGRWGFLVQADGYASKTTSTIPTGSSCDVTLEAGYRFAGTVIDSDTNEPVAGLRLVMIQDRVWLDKPEALTDDQGRYAFASLTKGTYTLWADDRPRIVPENQTKVDIEGSQDNVTIRLERGGVITGRIVDADTLEPIVGVVASAGLVDYTKAVHPRTYMTSESSDENGMYRIEGLPEGEYRVGFSSPWDLPRILPQGRDALPTISVRAGSVAEHVDYAAQRRYPVRGVVRDPEGEPVAGISVCDIAMDHPEWYESMSLWSSAPTDAEGCFTVWLPGAAQQVLLVGSSANWATHEYGPVAVGEGGVSGVALTAFPAAKIFGKVADSSDQGIPSLSFSYHGTRESATGAMPVSERLQYRLPTGFTDQYGRFYLAALPPDTYLFDVKGAQQTVTVGPGETVTDVVLHMAPEGSGAIEGRLTSEGEPVAGSLIQFFVEGGSGHYQTMSANDGTFQLAGLPGGRMQYHASQRSVLEGVGVSRTQSGVVDVASNGTTHLDIGMGLGNCAVEGLITEDGKPKRSAQLRFQGKWDDTTSEVTTVTSNDNGYYRVSGLSPDIGRIYFAVQPYATDRNDPRNIVYSYTYDVALVPGETVRRDIVLDMCTVIVTCSGIGEGEEGRLVLAQGAIDADEMSLPKVLALTDEVGFNRDMTENGTITIQGVAAGTYTLLFGIYDANADSDEARFNSLRYTHAIIEVTPNDDNAITFTLPPR